MDAEYLRANVGTVLAQGLADVVLNNPEDGVEYLAQYLLRQVAIEKRAGALAKSKAEAIDVDRVKEKELAVLAEAKATEEAERDSADKAAHGKVMNFLATRTSMDGLLQDFVSLLQERVGATSVYVGKLNVSELDPEVEEIEEGDEEEEEGDGEGGSNGATMHYVAATDDNTFLCDESGQHALRQTRSNVTFKLFEAPEEEDEDDDDEEEEYDDDGNLIPRPPKEVPEPVANTVHVPNTLVGPGSARLRFQRAPALGAYMAVHVKYEQALCSTALEDIADREREAAERAAEIAEERAAAEERGERYDDDDEEELDEDGNPIEDEYDDDGNLIPRRRAADAVELTEEEKAAAAAAAAAAADAALVEATTKPNVHYAVCLDTLGQNRRFTPAQIADVMLYCKTLTATMTAIDRACFAQERTRRTALSATNADEEAQVSLEDQQLQIDALQEEMAVEHAARVSAAAAEQQEREDAAAAAAGDDAAAAPVEQTMVPPLTEEDVAFEYRKRIMASPLVKNAILAWRDAFVFRGPVEVVQAAMYMLGYAREECANVHNVPQWESRMRRFCREGADDALCDRLQAFDPRAVVVRDAGNDFSQPRHIYELLGQTLEQVESDDGVVDINSSGGEVSGEGDYDYDTLRQTSYPLASLFAYVEAALALQRVAQAERDARRAAEEEEAARLEEERLEREAEEEEERLRREEEEEEEEDDDY